MDEIKTGIRAYILSEIDRLKKDIKSLKEQVKPISPDKAIGRLTRMEAINAKSIHEASLRSNTLKLAKLEQALKSVDGPDFGICSTCLQPIPVERLKVVPESTQCVKCIDGR